MTETKAKQIEVKGQPVRRRPGEQRDGWAGVFPAGIFYRRTMSAFGRRTSKHTGAKRGPPLKHKRTGDCPVCSQFPSSGIRLGCLRPGVPATKVR